MGRHRPALRRRPVPRPDRDAAIIEVCSGEPWNLTLRVETVGGDLLCRIHGGSPHVGAVSLGCFTAGRARAWVLEAEGHREGDLATLAARRLAAASRRNVACLAGIHYEGITRAGIDEVVRYGTCLVLGAARLLRARRSPGRSDASRPGRP